MAKYQEGQNQRYRTQEATQLHTDALLLINIALNPNYSIALQSPAVLQGHCFCQGYLTTHVWTDALQGRVEFEKSTNESAYASAGSEDEEDLESPQGVRNRAALQANNEQATAREQRSKRKDRVKTALEKFPGDCRSFATKKTVKMVVYITNTYADTAWAYAAGRNWRTVGPSHSAEGRT